jgi:GAF domain-containing protein
LGSKKKRATEKGSTELDQKREQFLQTFFQKGAQFAEDLLKENERLRYREAKLEADLDALKRSLGSEKGMQELLQRLHDAEREKHELLERFQHAQEVTRQYNERYQEIERELNDLASLYVASYQLHSTLDVRSVVRHIREMLHQLVGAQVFAVYFADESTRALGPIMTHGVEGTLPRVAAGEGHIGRAFTTGEMTVAASVIDVTNYDAPLACIPLRVEERVVGVIAVFRLLPQKRRFEPLDFELFKLLGAHAATALVGARLYARLAGKPLALEEYRDLS